MSIFSQFSMYTFEIYNKGKCLFSVNLACSYIVKVTKTKSISSQFGLYTVKILSKE